MPGQVTPLDRPLPPGEGRGEGLLLPDMLHTLALLRVVHYELRSEGHSSFAVSDSAKKMPGQVTPLDRPLPPGEGRGEGLRLPDMLHTLALLRLVPCELRSEGHGSFAASDSAKKMPGQSLRSIALSHREREGVRGCCHQTCYTP